MNAMQTKLEETISQINAVKVESVPVMTTDRHIPRKQQAALARKLFKSLGVRHLSVTTPNYSMASSVDVNFPAMELSSEDYMHNGESYQNRPWSEMPAEVIAKQKAEAKWAARGRLAEIINKAFPNHDDRSDSQSDYFDSCWTIDC